MTQLTAELERTHAHYQKLIERLGGPSYRSDMGPLETSGLDLAKISGALGAEQARPRSRHGAASPAESNGSAIEQVLNGPVTFSLLAGICLTRHAPPAAE